MPEHGVAVLIRVNLAEVKLRSRRGLVPRRRLLGPRRGIARLGRRLPMIQPILLVGCAATLGHAGIGSRQLFEDVHHAFRRGFQQDLLFAGRQVHCHQVPSGDHPTGDIHWFRGRTQIDPCSTSSGRAWRCSTCHRGSAPASAPRRSLRAPVRPEIRSAGSARARALAQGRAAR